ncbi:MAG: hypothetical protein KAJ35_06990, partial [Thermoplasmata archaeon]|nr:hypothetical protein [Thermoplasmata archaeon]
MTTLERSIIDKTTATIAFLRGFIMNGFTPKGSSGVPVAKPIQQNGFSLVVFEGFQFGCQHNLNIPL